MQQFLTWLWQGTTLAVGVWVVLRLLRPNAATRFAIWWAALVAVLLLLVAPALTRVPVDHASAVSSSGFLSLPLISSPLTLPAVPATVVAMGIGVWLGLAVLGLVHVGVSVSHLQQLKLACRPFPLARERRLSRWMAVRGEGRRTRLCVTEDVRSASALGLGLGAIIAINPSLLADLEDDELDHVVLHEYAHLQRGDDWLSVLQLALQALLVVHPAVSLIGRALRLEREAACDDFVVAQTGTKTGTAKIYARSLTKVAAFELASPNALIAAMGVVGRRGDVARRVARLLEPRRRPVLPRIAVMPAASLATVLIVATVGLSRLPPLVVTDGAAIDALGVPESASAALPSAAEIVTALDPLTRAAAIIVMPERLSEPEGAAIVRHATPRVHEPRAGAEGSPVETAANAAGAAGAGAAAEGHGRPPAQTSLGARVFAKTWTAAGTLGAQAPGASAAPRVHAAAVVPPGRGMMAKANQPAAATATPAPSPAAPDAMATAFDDELIGAPPPLASTAVPNTAKPSGAWQRAAGVGVSVGQGAKRVGTATGGFVSRVASSIGKVLP